MSGTSRSNEIATEKVVSDSATSHVGTWYIGEVSHTAEQSTFIPLQSLPGQMKSVIGLKHCKSGENTFGMEARCSSKRLAAQTANRLVIVRQSKTGMPWLLNRLHLFAEFVCMLW